MQQLSVNAWVVDYIRNMYPAACNDILEWTWKSKWRRKMEAVGLNCFPLNGEYVLNIVRKLNAYSKKTQKIGTHSAVICEQALFTCFCPQSTLTSTFPQVCWTPWSAACWCRTATCWQLACSPSTPRPARSSTLSRGNARWRWFLLSCPVWTTRLSSSWAAPTACRRTDCARDHGPIGGTRGTRTPTPARGYGLLNSCQVPQTCPSVAGGPSRTSPAPSAGGCSRIVCPFRLRQNTGKCNTSSESVNYNLHYCNSYTVSDYS